MSYLLGKVLAPAVTTLLVTAGVVALGAATTPPAQALAVPVNPVTVKVGEHRANSGFLVFVEHDVTLRNDESEGTMAMGGDLRIQQNYQIAGSSSVSNTFTDAGDNQPTNLFVGGGIRWDSNNANVYVQQGLTKVADTSDLHRAREGREQRGAELPAHATRSTLQQQPVHRRPHPPVPRLRRAPAEHGPDQRGGVVRRLPLS